MKLIYDAFRERNEGSLHIVRYNPDPYRTKQGLIIKHSRDEQVAAIKQMFQYTPKHKLTISYCFYRLENGMPEITLRNDFALRDHVGMVI